MKITYRVRRQSDHFRVERNTGRGQIAVVDSFGLRSTADALVDSLREDEKARGRR